MNVSSVTGRENRDRQIEVSVEAVFLYRFKQRNTDICLRMRRTSNRIEASVACALNLTQWYCGTHSN